MKNFSVYPILPNENYSFVLDVCLTYLDKNVLSLEKGQFTYQWLIIWYDFACFYQATDL